MQPATEANINNLEIILYKQDNTPKECTICFENFAESDSVIYLNCEMRHVYHADCLKKWLRVNAICPLCRTPIF